LFEKKKYNTSTLKSMGRKTVNNQSTIYLLHVYFAFHFSIVFFKKCFFPLMSDKEITCKTNTLTILMHKMRISTTQVSSVMLRSKKLEILKKKCENRKSHRMKTKQRASKLSQIRRRMSDER
jgi:hypothetical protein